MSRRSPLTASAALLALACVCALPVAAARADDEPVPREVEYAIDHGLEWLSKCQSKDGSWGTEPSTIAASTALSTMAYMARGHVPGQGPYGENINHGVDALLSKQGNNGVINSRSGGMIGNATMYEHGICTVALCEAYGMLDPERQTKVRVAIAKAARVILDAQRVKKPPEEQGGWRYENTSTDSDISVSGWQLMALRGASNAGANIPQQAIDDGIAYIKKRAVPSGGFSYRTTSGPNPARTGTGVLALSLMGKPDMDEVKAGGDYLIRTPLGNGDGHYFYTVYYCAQAAWQLGDKYWPVLNPRITQDVLKKQKGDGSWGGGETSDQYCTAMAILALSVPYRYLPIYQR